MNRKLIWLMIILSLLVIACNTERAFANLVKEKGLKSHTIPYGFHDNFSGIGKDAVRDGMPG
jgi:predicted small secreted protein